MGNGAMPDLPADDMPGNVSPAMMLHNLDKIERLVLQENRNDYRIVVFPWSGGFLFRSFLNRNRKGTFLYELNRAYACNHT